MIKLASLLLILAGSVAGTVCPALPITQGAGSWPATATNLTTIDKGTNCTIKFNIPNNYVILFRFSSDFQSTDDVVTIYDNNGQPKYTLVHQGKVAYNNILYMPATTAQVQVVSASGNTRFYLSYQYISLANYVQVKKNTGDYFQLSAINPNQYFTFTSANDNVIITYAIEIGSKTTDVRLSEYYVYDGDNINTAKMIGNLGEIGRGDVPGFHQSTGKSYTIVNFFGTRSSSYVIGNDASTIQGHSKYTVLWHSQGLNAQGNMTDLSDGGALYTYICSDCSTYYWTSMRFDSLATISNKGYVTFQGQTPTHKKDKLIKYDPMTLTDSYFPQMIPTGVITLNLYLSRISFNFNTINDGTVWKKAYEGRKGYIFSPNLWSTVANSFNTEIRDDSQLYKFVVNMNKMNMGNVDSMTLKIGPTKGDPAVNNVYPRDKSSNGQVVSNGNYMTVGITSSVTTDVRLSFEVQKASATTVAGLLVSVIFAAFYTL
uniref:CUB_2 domain-containing protein n=1 Tax=Caenorhabditis tropicalis TaxID=1561998 RepID=A0A1I7U285_9PELO